ILDFVHILFEHHHNRIIKDLFRVLRYRVHLDNIIKVEVQKMEGLAAFITITLMIIIVPGPDFFVVMKNSITSVKGNGSIAEMTITTRHVDFTLLVSLHIYFIMYI